MTSALTESQQVARDLAAQLFGKAVTPDRLAEVEASDQLFDGLLWTNLAHSGLIGLCLPADVGGEGLGFAELALICEQQGAHVAPVPLVPTMVSALAVDRWGAAELRQKILRGVVEGTVILAAALSGIASAQGIAVRAAEADGGWRLEGSVLSVPGAPAAGWILVPAVDETGAAGLFAVDTSSEGVSVTPARTTDRQLHGHLDLRGAAAEHLGGVDALSWLEQRMAAALCAVQAGVARTATEMAAAYISQRQQFGKPLAYFQGTLLRVADALIAAETVQVTAYAAAVALAERAEAVTEVAVAKWWTSEGGTRSVEAALHLHGGAGNVLDHPLPRYYLWAKQIDVALGGAAYQLQVLGERLADGRATQRSEAATEEITHG